MIELKIQKELRSSGGKMLLDIELSVGKGDFVTLYGKSGVGKTSLLMLLAGLMRPDNGFIRVGDQVWTDLEKGIWRRPQERNVGLVFQEYALFPNMTVMENLDYAMRKGQKDDQREHLIEIMDLNDLKNRKPDTLSGGQKQRVALARALVNKPSLLLLDEPLSALDQDMRGKLQQYILQVHREYGLTTLMISHDVTEIIKMSDYVMEMDHGQVIRKATPGEIFTHEKLNAKFQFTGEVMKMTRQDFIVIVTVLVGRELVKVVANDSEVEGMEVGDRVLIASKAFNPVIHKIS
ncbi:MAG: ATP-binding cassette domain-containing protein [Lutimonas sp.]